MCPLSNNDGVTSQELTKRMQSRKALPEEVSLEASVEDKQ